MGYQINGLDQAIAAGSFSYTVPGTDGDDDLAGQYGSDIINGGRGNDHLRGLYFELEDIASDGDDRLDGGEGNDIIEDGGGSDVIIGGPGVDLVMLAHDSTQDTIVFKKGDAVVSATPVQLQYGQTAVSDKVESFDPSSDIIQVSGYGLTASQLVSNTKRDSSGRYTSGPSGSRYHSYTLTLNAQEKVVIWSSGSLTERNFEVR